MIEDPLEATIVLLKGNAEMMEHVDKVGSDGASALIRIYGDEMPKEEADFQPRKCLVLRHVPNVQPIGGFLELQNTGFDAFTYGYSPKEARDLYGVLVQALKYADRQLIGNTLLHSYSQRMAPRAMREPKEQWPFVLSSWNCLSSENTVSS